MKELFSYKKIALSVFGIGISTVAIYKVSEYFNYKELINLIENIGFLKILLLMTLYMTSFIFRGLRWKMMLEPLKDKPLNKVTNSVILGFAANNLLPMRLGEVMRAFHAGKNLQISKITALSSIVAEKILDGLVIVFYTFLGSVFLLPEINLQIIVPGLITFMLCLMSLSLLANNENRLKKFLLDKTLRHQSFRNIDLIWNPIFNLFEKISTSIRVFGRKEFISVLILSIVIWLIEGLVFIIMLYTLGYEKPIFLGLFTLGIVNLGILIPSAPGYVGVFQASASLAFLWVGLDQKEAIPFSIILHAVQFIPVTVTGMLIMFRESQKSR